MASDGPGSQKRSSGGADGTSTDPGPGGVLAVLGHVIWDTIVHPGDGDGPLEGWGGISYSLEALAPALPPGWRVLPMVKVGEDRAESGLEYLTGIPRVTGTAGLRVVTGPTHTVELRYRDRARRWERLSGAIPPWTWEEMEPILAQADALYVNFITGFELNLETVRLFRRRLSIPLYADLHSLFLGVTSGGRRYSRPLPEWMNWAQAFDVVQVNQDELELLGAPSVGPWAAAERALGADLKLIAVTLGSSGARYLAHPTFREDPLAWPAQRGLDDATTGTRSGTIDAPSPGGSGDPTGCGDVWGATFFARLLAGDPLETAIRTANRRGAGNVAHRGAEGLGEFLGSGVWL